MAEWRLKQLRRLDVQSIRQAAQHGDGRCMHPALDQAHIFRAHAGAIRQLLLAQLLFVAEPPNVARHDLLEIHKGARNRIEKYASRKYTSNSTRAPSLGMFTKSNLLEVPWAQRHLSPKPGMRLVYVLEGIGGTTRSLRTWHDPRTNRYVDVFSDESC